MGEGQTPSISDPLIGKAGLRTGRKGEGSPSVQVGAQKITNLALPPNLRSIMFRFSNAGRAVTIVVGRDRAGV
jgi:hypothetical protein